MGIRRSALVVVLLFAVLVAGVTFAASRADRDALEPLPSLATAHAETALLAPSDTPLAPLSYTVKGKLPALEGEAPAYRLPATTAGARVRSLARALKLDGEVREDEAGWSVSGGDATLTVARLPGLPWHLSTGCPDRAVRSDGPAVTACAQAVPAVVEPAGRMGAGVTPGGAAPPCKPCPPGEACTEACDSDEPGSPPDAPPAGREPAPPAISPPRPVDLPARDQAERIVRDTLDRLGVDAAGLRLEGGEWGWQAVVDRQVDGRQVRGWQTTVLLGSAGRVVGASGQLAEPDRIGDYPLAGTPVGLERLRRAPTAVPQPLPGGGQSPGCGAAPCEVAPVDPGACPPVACRDLPAPEPAPALVIVDAHLALEAAGDKLVPVYVFELEGQGDGPSVPAVTDRWLERRPSEPEPEPEPRPEPAPGPGADPVERVAAEWRLVDPDDRDAVLELRYVHGGCLSLDGVEVDESAEAVTVTVFNRHSGADVCTEELRVGDAQARLRAPLGDRRLLGACRPGEGACDVLAGPAS